MNTDLATRVVGTWFGTPADPQLVTKLSSTLPEPERWAVYDDPVDKVRRLLSLTKRSLFVVWQEGDVLRYGRAVVTEDPADTAVAFRDGPMDQTGTWHRVWQFDFRMMPRDFPEIRFTTAVAADEPDFLESFAREIARLAGWEIG